ncbi:MAG: hypothetical protein AAB734_01065 [Patescibacteria group bacterium]
MHRIDHNGNSRLNALAEALLAATLLFLLYKLGVYYKFLPDAKIPQYVESGWNAVFLSGVASWLWFISAKQSDKSRDVDDWTVFIFVVTWMTFIVSLVWMVFYTVYYGYFA